MCNQTADDFSKVRRILVVDDEEIVQRVLFLHLVREGFSVETVSRGNSAVIKLKDAFDAGEPFDLVISDVIMPGMDGLSLLDWIQINQSDISVLVVQGRLKDDLDLQHVRPDMDAFLPEPFEVLKLMANIANINLLRAGYFENKTKNINQ